MNPDQANNYGTLATYLRRECDTFLTIPGLNSLYFWTGKPPPAYIALGGEGLMASPGQQFAAVAALKDAQHPLIVLWESHWSSAVKLGQSRDGPLLRFIHEDCRQVGMVGPYLILAPCVQTNSLPTY
jgi:hypothetical protein